MKYNDLTEEEISSRVVGKSLGVGWGEETLFLLPRRSRRSTPTHILPSSDIHSPHPPTPHPTNYPTTQPPKQPTTHPPCPTPTPPSLLTPPKDAADGLQRLMDAPKVPAGEACPTWVADTFVQPNTPKKGSVGPPMIN
ncbi:hypothetical protein PGT21_028190 [Puccinia graminis f. sp. tritici]|uniref:Uncharacterized protein n=1 Tax=Puccinia graminis f. sp. tritici TaxID=56615 RepID=A0A5B0Q6X2_PUCGR|nr:hypothetical protein PGT21_028190 [Puccinia graminis f. sp. tritici]